MTISLLVEVPEALHDALSVFLELHPDWDQDRAMAAALGLFLTQNAGDRRAGRVYLDALFKSREKL